jgi:uncharacterized membrane protein YgcG
MVVIILVVGCIGLAFVWNGGVPSSGDGRSLQWDRFDVTINHMDTAQNAFDVTETYVLRVGTGPFRFGTAYIPEGRTEGINNVQIYENDRAMQNSCGGEVPGTYCVTHDNDNINIKYYFFSTLYSSDRTTVRLQYHVNGGLRSYSGGDQLYWVAVPSDRPFDVRDSTVTVYLPQDRLPMKIASYPDTWKSQIQGNVVTWTSPGVLEPGDQVEVRVQYPHDPAMSKPNWQAGYDREQWYKDNVQPVVSLAAIGLGLLLALGGVLSVLTGYLRRGRDPQSVVVPTYLTEPPSDESPGVVGVLLDERADMQDIMSTLVDLAQRGCYVIEQRSAGGIMGMFASSDFVFHRSDTSPETLASHEQTMMRGLFGGKHETSLSDLRQKFYQYIPAMKQQLYNEAVERGYFERSPETIRTNWMWGGAALMVIGFGMIALAHSVSLLVLLSPYLPFIPAGLIVIGASAALASGAMPARTATGAQEAAKWRAFRHYLENIEKYTDISEAAQKFDKLIGYAVAFGIQNEVIKRVTPAMTEMPRWYYPTYMGGPWHGGYRRDTTGPIFGDSSGGNPLSGRGLQFDGPGGLNSMSETLTQGLNSMNSGMTQLLNDASHAMTSRPQSSGGSGGFSGGGGHGGGGGGGGGRGFG